MIDTTPEVLTPTPLMPEGYDPNGSEAGAEKYAQALLAEAHTRYDSTARFLVIIATIKEHGLHRFLGYTDFTKFMDKEFGIGKTTARNWVIQGKALLALPPAPADEGAGQRGPRADTSGLGIERPKSPAISARAALRQEAAARPSHPLVQEPEIIEPGKRVEMVPDEKPPKRPRKEPTPRPPDPKSVEHDLTPPLPDTTVSVNGSAVPATVETMEQPPGSGTKLGGEGGLILGVADGEVEWLGGIPKEGGGLHAVIGGRKNGKTSITNREVLDALLSLIRGKEAGELAAVAKASEAAEILAWVGAFRPLRSVGQALPGASGRGKRHAPDCTCLSCKPGKAT